MPINIYIKHRQANRYNFCDVGGVCFVMNKVIYQCYIQEYRNESGGLCVRLRDKKTNKKVSLVSNHPFMKQRFLAFLSSAKRNQHIMPTIYDKNGIDTVQVCGLLLDESNDEIKVNPYGCIGGGFLFK